MSAAHDPAVCELLSFFDTEHLPAHLAEAARPFCAVARALVAGDVGPVLDLVEPGGRVRIGSRECRTADVKLLMARDILRSGRAAISGLAPVLRLLLEAKDCAVRAVLVVQRSMGPEAVEQLAQVLHGSDEQTARPNRDLETELLMFADRIDSAARHPSCGVTPRTWIQEDLGRLREIARSITSKGAAKILTRVHAALNRAGVPGTRSEADSRVDALAGRSGIRDGVTWSDIMALYSLRGTATTEIQTRSSSLDRFEHSGLIERRRPGSGDLEIGTFRPAVRDWLAKRP